MPSSMNFPHKKGKLLSEVSTFGIGGPARFFAEATTIEAIQQMLREAQDLPLFILGKGSNALFDDRGFNGLVILNKITHCKQISNTFCVGSGLSFPRLGTMAAKQNYTGLEFAAGIPATVGGAIYMNAGANGQETGDCLTQVRFVNRTGELQTFQKQELEFSYRTSSFQKMRGAIVEGTFTLQPSTSAKADQRKIIDYRLETQPYGMKSAGCIFRNPGPAAGQLIEQAGLKGLRVGGVSVSQMHANFIVNDEKGSAQDVLTLIEQVKERVYHEKGIQLEEEIRYIPYNDNI